MAWSIGCIENTLKISDACAVDLFKALKKSGREVYDRNDIVDKGLIYFNQDDNEHMDFLWEKEVIKVLKKHKVEGNVTFGSLEGDNEGECWKYTFAAGKAIRSDGKLGMVGVPKVDFDYKGA